MSNEIKIVSKRKEQIIPLNQDNDNLKNLVNTTQQIIAENSKRFFEAIKASLNLINVEMNKSIRSIFEATFPKITESEEDKKLIEVWQNWGKLGWTLLPAMPFDLFKDTDINDANQKIIESYYLNEKNISNLFTVLKDLFTNNNDILEAMDDYEQGKYKSCILILFSMVDAFSINLTDKKGGVNHRAVEKVIEKLKENKKSFLKFIYSGFIGSYECVEAMFKGYANFEADDSKFEVPNRHYIAHGVSKREISKIDCLKIFAVLYNLYVLSNYSVFNEIFSTKSEKKI